MLYIRIFLDVCQQVEAEFIQAQIHDVDAGIHILYVHHFFLKLPELVLAVFQVALLVLRQQVVVARTGEDGSLHTALYTTFQFDILVQLHIRPVVNQLDDIVSAAYTVHTAEALDDAHWIPMDIIVDEEITILQVLALGNAVGGNEHINLLGGIREESSPVFRYGREIGQHIIETHRELRYGAFAIRRTRDKRHIQPTIRLDACRQLVVKIVGGISKGCKDNHLLVARIDGMLKLVLQIFDEHLQLGVVLGRNILEHHLKQGKILLVAAKIT